MNKRDIMHRLTLAIRHGKLETARKLINSYGLPYSESSPKGYDLLCDALNNKHSEIAKLLLTSGSEVNSKKNFMITPLHFAVINGDKEIIKMLLVRGANINAQDYFGQTPLHETIENDDQVEIIELLLKHEADVNVKNRFGRTPLYKAIQNNRLEIIELILKHKADINVEDEIRNTPLFYAIENENLKITKLLLDNGANVKDYPELLNIAVRRGCTEIVELLLQHNADVNATDKYGKTALFLAVISDPYSHKTRFGGNSYANIKRKITKLLLDHGANVDAQTPDGETPLQFAMTNKYLPQVVEVLLEYNANVNVRQKKSLATPLHMSARRKNVEICKILLNKGVDVDAVDCDGCTALHIATEKGSNDIVKLLLERGAKVDSKTKYNITPLYFSALKGYQEIMETLLKSDADINFRDMNGNTALHIASQLGHNKVVTTLLEYGSDINIMAYNNLTPLDYAKTNITIKILKRHIIQMKTANLYVSQRNLLSVDGISYRNFQEKCENEITSMKSEKMNNYISFYDILIKNTDSLAICLRNENIVQILKLDDYKTKFPIYGSIVKSRFRNGMKRKELLDQGNQILRFLFTNHLQLPQECTEKIFSYLSDEDLKIIIEKSKDK